ncbi:Low affinity glucose transporter 1 [Komagataella phaffii CBS 7435]|uniref:High-affinity glucose transporter of the major facilitator superfamily n=3 Tax=Komagataella TaxID=460517 RepID=C4QYV2_KOMPG|nr:High-affinity glucose transporter of the major facilitator superfamily [Komagataella phaffii GS115]ADM96218.1 hexose transporter 1 [Komagataella pastoris]AOA61052.1 GQ67_01574T0 [Komagataella phaffii]CAH2447252.1 Low affinity glucose transporter 1 [Komagataella phaffii CBS 7435]AOA66259.1 GQ68_01590T0 [Komagataella phaffii GS115]CAY68426.1 High-affinity glucose transporter of the major facilitator superfamily [Komagataella phaffii GS115]
MSSTDIQGDQGDNEKIYAIESSPSNEQIKDIHEAPADNKSELDIPVKPKGSYILVSVLCLLVAFGGFVFGWDTGTISGFVNMSDFTRRFGQFNGETYYLSKVRVGLIVSIFNIGCAIGGVTLGKLGDIWGRKKALMFVMVIYMVGILIQIASIDKWYQYFIGRIIAGLAVGAVSVLSPMFISETSPKHIRGSLVSCYQLMITAGIFLGYCTTYGTKTYTDSTQWRVPLGLCFAWAILMIVGMTFMPESPRFLVEVNRVDEAMKSIARVNKVSIDDPSVYNEMRLISDGIEKEKEAGSVSWGELFTGKPKIFYRLLIGIFMQSLQQLTGNNYFFYYGTTIFKAVGLDDSFQTSIILGVVNFASTFLGIYTMDKFGRRRTLLGGSGAMVVCLVIFSSVGVKSLYENGKDDPSKPAGNAMIVFTCLFIFFFACTWAPGVFVVVSETYPLRIRSKGMAIAQGSNWLWGFLIAFFTPFISGAIDFAYGYVFMGCTLFAFFFVYFFVPETKGLSLEDVDEVYENLTFGRAYAYSHTIKDKGAL